MKLRILSVVLLITLVMFVAPTEAFAVIQSLDGLTPQNQTFTDDSNITITPSGSTHTLGWQGLLPLSRGGTGASSFTAGSLLFSNGTSITQDNSNLFWDNVNKQLSIGTSLLGSNLLRLGVAGGAESTAGIIRGADATTSNTQGGLIQIIAGNSTGTAWGGRIDLITGSGGETGRGADVNIDTGNGGSTSGDGGSLSVTMGSAPINGNGGSVDLQAGRGGDVSGNGGNITLLPGGAEVPGTTGTIGRVMIMDPRTNTIWAIFDTDSLTNPQTFTFPNASGTFGLLETDQTWSGLNKFEASSNSTIYVGSSVKSGCIAMGDSDGSGITYVTANDGVLSASSTKPSFCQ